MCYSINGNWKAGWAIDLHTVKSVKINESTFDNTYSEIGKSLNLLKYHNDYLQIDYLANSVVDFLKTRMVTPYIDVIVPTPPSNMNRELQPVYEIAKKVSNMLSIPLDIGFIQKTKNTSELKKIDDKIQREKVLKGVFKVTKSTKYINKKILLFDDLFRSGSTLNEITRTLYQHAGVQNVYVVTLTKTRTNGLSKKIYVK